MGARPPPQETDDHGTTEFGIAALDAHLEETDLTYPVSDAELVRALGDPEIPIDVHGHAVPLSEIVDRANATEFGSSQEILNALHPVFEAKREETSLGLLGSIRSVLPF